MDSEFLTINGEHDLGGVYSGFGLGAIDAYYCFDNIQFGYPSSDDETLIQSVFHAAGAEPSSMLEAVCRARVHCMREDDTTASSSQLEQSSHRSQQQVAHTS